MSEFDDDLELDPVAADAQLALHSLSHNPWGIELWLLVEELREERIRNEAQRELFERTSFRDDTRYKEIERRAMEAEIAGRRCWKLKMTKEAEAHWRRADELWSVIDGIESRQHAVDFAYREQREKSKSRTNTKRRAA